jgi:hypothetical protein
MPGDAKTTRQMLFCPHRDHFNISPVKNQIVDILGFFRL